MKNTRTDRQPEADYDEEREGLLTGKEDLGGQDEQEHQDVSRKRVYFLAAVLSVIMLGAVLVPPYLKPPQRRPVADFDSRKLRSNGTHAFRKTSLIVSIDGLRSVYHCNTSANTCLTYSGQSRVARTTLIVDLHLTYSPSVRRVFGQNRCGLFSL